MPGRKKGDGTLFELEQENGSANRKKVAILCMPTSNSNFTGSSKSEETQWRRIAKKLP